VTADVQYINLEPVFPPTDECRICDVEVVLLFFGQNYAIAMYEDKVVPDEWTGDWGGFTCCKECFDKNERGELPRWTVAELEHMTGHKNAA
jgi:hypothetical protein